MVGGGVEGVLPTRSPIYPEVIGVSRSFAGTSKVAALRATPGHSSQTVGNAVLISVLRKYFRRYAAIHSSLMR